MLRLRLMPVAAVLIGALGCGPIQSTKFLLDAEVQIEAARTAQADKLAPYEWTLANLYIHKAREEVGYSDFEVGVEFARKAAEFANDARKAAMQAGQKLDASGNPELSPSSTP